MNYGVFVHDCAWVEDGIYLFESRAKAVAWIWEQMERGDVEGRDESDRRESVRAWQEHLLETGDMQWFHIFPVRTP